MSKLEIYTEYQWFTKFYPESWGDWRKTYNYKNYIDYKHHDFDKDENYKGTGCRFSDYINYYAILDNKNTLINVYYREQYNIVDGYFLECNHRNDLDYSFQPLTGKFYVKIMMYKIKSNLDLYAIIIPKANGKFYTLHTLGLIDLISEIGKLNNFGFDVLKKENSNYFLIESNYYDNQTE